MTKAPCVKNLSFDKYLNYLIIGYAFILPISIAANVLFTHLIILAFILKGKFIPEFYKLKNFKPLIVLSLFILLSLVSVIWSSDKVFALLYIKKYYHFLIIPIIYLHLDKKYITHVFTSFLLGMLFSEIFSYAIFFELIHYNNISPNDPTPFMNHISYSIYLSFASMILLNRVFFTKHNGLKLFYILYFLTTISNLFMNGGRTGQIIFIASLFLIILLNVKSRFKAIITAVTLSILIITSAYNFSPVFKARGTQAYTDVTQALFYNNYSGSFGKRVALWIMGAKVFSNNIFLGTGIGDEASGMHEYAKQHNIAGFLKNPDKGHIDFHNMYIQHAVQLGITGLMLMLYLVYSMYAIKFKSLLYRNLNIVFATSFTISATAGNNLDTLFSMSFFALFVAIFGVISRTEHQK